jgi:hypothetical protein
MKYRIIPIGVRKSTRTMSSSLSDPAEFESDTGTNFFKELKHSQADSCTTHRLNNNMKRCLFTCMTEKAHEQPVDNYLPFKVDSIKADIDESIYSTLLKDIPRQALFVL